MNSRQGRKHDFVTVSQAAKRLLKGREMRQAFLIGDKGFAVYHCV
jgi:hypothetical protein